MLLILQETAGSEMKVLERGRKGKQLTSPYNSHFNSTGIYHYDKFCNIQNAIILFIFISVVPCQIQISCLATKPTPQQNWEQIRFG